mgnify:CR=1 FL=1
MLRNDGKSQSEVVAELTGREFKLLVLDIETSPNVGYFWGGLFDNNFGLNQVTEWGGVICFAAKWYGKSKVHFASDFHDGHENMVQAAWDLLDEADAVCHFNGKAFDIKHLNREFLLQGLTPPSPFKDIDLLTAARGNFKFSSNKLQHITEALELGSKVEHEGFDLWKKCMAGDTKAWARMKKYNVGDITITEAVYEQLRPWIKGHPHVGLWTGDSDNCRTCNSSALGRRGHYRTNTGVYYKFQCKDCGTYSRSRNRLSDVGTSTRVVT